MTCLYHNLQHFDNAVNVYRQDIQAIQQAIFHLACECSADKNQRLSIVMCVGVQWTAGHFSTQPRDLTCLLQE